MREKPVPVLIVELRKEATRRFVRREMRQAYSAGLAARCLAAEKQPDWAMLFALGVWR